MALQRSARVLAAGLVLTGGLVHLNLWQHGYRAIPKIGPLFLVNMVASVVVAVALLVSAARPVILVGVALSLGSLAALAVSRTVGLFGFMDVWTPESMRVIAAEVGAVVAIAMAAVLRHRPTAQLAWVRNHRG
jgi:hypothetical protein